MPNKDKIYLIIILVVIILFGIREGCNRKQSEQSATDVANYKTESQTYKTKLGLKVNTNGALGIASQDQISAMLASNDTIKQWLSKFKEIKGGMIVKETTIIREVAVPFDRQIPCDFKPFKANKLSKDFQFYSTIANTGLTIDSLKIPNTATIVIGDRRVGLLKDEGFLKLKTKFVVDVNNSNPYIQTSNIAGYVYTPKKKWYETTIFHFSLGAGLALLGDRFSSALINRIK